MAANLGTNQEKMTFEDLYNKYNSVRRENKQLRGMLKQNELIMQANISQLKNEKNASTRLLPTLLPIAQKFSMKIHKNKT
jgi:hypothetical protein